MNDLINTTVSILEEMIDNVKKYKNDKKFIEIINKFINKKIKPNTITNSLKGKGRGKGKKGKGKKGKSKKGKGLKFIDPLGIGPNTIHEDEVWIPPNTIHEEVWIPPRPIGMRERNERDRKLVKEGVQSPHFIFLLICIYYITTGESINAIIYLFAYKYLMN